MRCAEYAKQHNTILHFHLSETEKEVADCVAEHGLTPVRWLDSLGVLSSNCVAAHVVHVDEEEIQILKDRGVAIAHNPVSNMKLSSGYFKSLQMQEEKAVNAELFYPNENIINCAECPYADRCKKATWKGD